MKLKVACVQLNGGVDIQANIAKVEQLTAAAAAQGAELVALPENTFVMEEQGKPRTLYDAAAHPGIKASAEMAKKHKIWLLAGSVAVRPDSSPRRGEVGRGALFAPSERGCPLPSPPPAGEGKTYNRSLLFNPQGEQVALYDKIHLFDVEVGDGQVYKESAKILPGCKAAIAVVDGGRMTDDGKPDSSSVNRHPSTKLGLSVCYDLRFPQLYRALAKAGAEILCVPAAFTQKTGEAHWHVLLRARAIENGCYVIAPAQTGTHAGGRRTFGHSLIIDPWGTVLADAGTEEGIIVAQIDTDMVSKVRSQIPSLSHDRQFDLC